MSIRRFLRPLSIVACVIVVLGGSIFLFREELAKQALYAGNTFFGGGMPYNLRVADTTYRTALFLDARTPDAWHQRARIAFLRSDFDGAREMIDKQIEIHGDTFMASYYIRGLIAGYDKRFAEAEGDFQHFLTWDPNNWAANNDLAWIYFSQGKFVETERQARLGLAYNPGNPWLHLMLGMALHNQGKTDAAKTELELARAGVAMLTEADWHKAYPGNDPSVATNGLSAMRETIDRNIELLNR